MLLRLHAGVTPNVAKAVFSGARGDACKDFINRICDATGRADVKERLDGPFTQLGLITSARNAIVHWGAAKQSDDTIFAINDFLAATEAKLRKVAVNPEILRDMTYDLAVINMLLVREAALRMRNLRPGTLDEIDEVMKGSDALKARLGVVGPWLYKPPRPPPAEKGTRARRRAHRLLPDASQK